MAEIHHVGSTTKVREYLKQYGRENDVIEIPENTATVELAAKALNILPAMVAKTLSFIDHDKALIVVVSGDAKVDGPKFKAKFHMRCRMIPGDMVEELTGHPPGGVCPFANPAGTRVYLDISLKRFSHVYPGCGGDNGGIKLTCDELYTYSHAIEWIDICKDWDPELKD